MVGLALWPKPRRLRSFAGHVVRVDDAVSRCVVFIGYADSGGAFEAVGTGFFLAHHGHRYLVTAQHIAVGLGDDPFALRLNTRDGGSVSILVDPLEHGIRWFNNTDDPDVDLAVLPFDYDLSAEGCDPLFIPPDMLATLEQRGDWNIGIGDTCYAIGLFRLMVGSKRNLPVVHTGSIALMPGDERIPVVDWMGPTGTRKRRHVEGYLVEMQNLKGLSGSPVMVRPSVETRFLIRPDGRKVAALAPSADMLLLGMWQGSWDAPPDEVMAVDRGEQTRVPVGMGIVVPADQMVRLLDRPELEKLRQEQDEKWAANEAASPDAERRA